MSSGGQRASHSPVLGITCKSVVTGIILSAFHTCLAVRGEMGVGFQGTGGTVGMFTTGMLIVSAVGFLFLITLANSVLKRVSPERMYSPAEMMVIFSMITVSAVITGFDLLQNLFPIIMWPFNANSPSAGLDKYFRYIPSYFVPQGESVRKQFFYGGQTTWYFLRSEILRPWMIPLVFWGGFVTLLSFSWLCMSSIFRRHWMDNEKLPFPILDLPLMMAKENNAGSMFRSRLFLIGFVLAAALYAASYASQVYPWIPHINLDNQEVGNALFPSAPAKGMNPIYVAWWPFAFGLCYLIPLDISFSCWFFFVLLRLMMLYATSCGWREPNAGWSSAYFPFFQKSSEGAMVSLSIVFLWGARLHLARVWRIAVGAEKDRHPDREMMSYRFALFGALGSILALISIAILSGMRPHVAILFFVLYCLSAIVMARIFAQVAIPSFELGHFSTPALLVDLTGTSGLTPQDGTMLTFFHLFNRAYRTQNMGHELESAVGLDKVGSRVRPIGIVIMLATVIGVIVGLLTLMQIYYDYGAASGRVGWNQYWVGYEAWTRLQGWTANPQPPHTGNLAAMGVSALVVFLLTMARQVWFSFPLHPIGYALVISFSMDYVWNIVLIVWLIKFLVIRYGGLRVYRYSLPLFYGLIVGDAISRLVGSLVMWALGA